MQLSIARASEQPDPPYSMQTYHRPNKPNRAGLHPIVCKPIVIYDPGGRADLHTVAYQIAQGCLQMTGKLQRDTYTVR